MTLELDSKRLIFKIFFSMISNNPLCFLIRLKDYSEEHSECFLEDVEYSTDKGKHINKFIIRIIRKHLKDIKYFRQSKMYR